MRLVDQLRSVRHTFSSHRVRTVLTLLGIIIGAGSIVLLVSLLHGGKQALASSSMRAGDGDVVMVDERPAVSTKEDKRPTRALGRVDGAVLHDSPLLGGAEVAAEKTRWTEALVDREKKQVALVSAGLGTFGLYHLKLAEGRLLSADDLSQRRRVAVVGRNVADELFPGGALGKRVRVDGASWMIVGVLANKPSIGGGAQGPWLWNNKVITPETTFDALYNVSHGAGHLFVRASGQGPIEPRLAFTRNVVDSTLLRRHFGVSNFAIDRHGQEGKQERMIMQVIEVLLLGTSLLSLFVGGINIMNIMLVTVTDRTREIGIRRAIGASPHSIMVQFLLEAALIAGVGGLIGVLGAALTSWGLSLLLARSLGEWQFYIAPWSVAVGLLLSLGTGVVFGLFPAWRASRLVPVEALRYE